MLSDVIDMQPVIKTKRFDLRPLKPSDAKQIEQFALDERVARNTVSIPHPLPPGTAKKMVESAMAKGRREDLWAMDGTKSGRGEFMGQIALRRVSKSQSEISFWVVPAFWNTGVATEAVRALVNANPHGCQTVFACVFQDNPPSSRVLTNCGFGYLGDAEAHSVARGANVPTWTYVFSYPKKSSEKAGANGSAKSGPKGSAKSGAKVGAKGGVKAGAKARPKKVRRAPAKRSAATGSGS